MQCRSIVILIIIVIVDLVTNILNSVYPGDERRGSPEFTKHVTLRQRSSYYSIVIDEFIRQRMQPVECPS